MSASTPLYQSVKAQFSQFFPSRWKGYLWAYFVPTVIFMILGSSYVALSDVIPLEMFMGDPSAINPLQIQAALTNPMFWGPLVLLLLVYIVVMIPLNVGFTRQFFESSPDQSFMGLWRSGSRKIWSLIGRGILLGLLMMLVYAAGAGLMALFTVFLELPGIVTGILGVLVAIALAVIVFHWIFAGYYLIIEDLGPVESVKASWATVSKAPWRLFGLFIVAVIAAMILGVVFAIVTGIVQYVLTMISDTVGIASGVVVNQLFQMLLSYIGAVFMISVFAAMKKMSA